MAAKKTYSYIARDTQGMRQTGVVEAQSEGHLRSLLTRRGLSVEIVQEGKTADGDRNPFTRGLLAPIFGRVNYETLQRFFAQLHSMHKAGVPLHQSLDTLARSQRHPKLRAVIRDMQQHILAGRSISEAMERYPEVFSSLQINLIKAGEQGGVLEQSLFYVSDYLAREVRLRNKMKTATFYPKLLLFFIIAIPIVTNLITSSIAGRQASSGIFSLGDQGWFMALLIVFVVFWLFVFPVLIQNRSFKHLWDSILLAIPYTGSTIRMFSMAKFGRAFSALYGGGVPISQSLILAADANGNEYIRRKILPAAAWIQEGKPIAESMLRTGAFTDIAIDMAQTGELTGSMESMLTNVADQYEDEAEVRVDKLSRVIPVVLLIIGAIVVGYVVVGFYTSYFGAIMSEG